MTDREVIIVDEAGGQTARALASSLEAAWAFMGSPAQARVVPALAQGARATFHAIFGTGLADGDLHASAVDRSALRRVGAVVVVGAPESAFASTLADVLAEHVIPVVVVAHRPRHAASLVEAGGIVMPPSVDPGVLAAMVFALVARQSAVDAMSSELHVLQAAQGGIRGEMERMHEEMQLASAVQREFLPRTLPRAPGLDFAVLFRPASYVSGDIYDVQALDSRHVGIFIADAVGHGVPAALLTMYLTRSLVTAEGFHHERRLLKPAETLTRLNHDLCARQQGTARFATAVYGLIDTVTREVTLAGAGHPPPLRIRGQEVDSIETDGPLLGVFAEAEFTEQRFTLEPGQALLLHTDGLEMAFPQIDPTTGRLRQQTKAYRDHLMRLARAAGLGSAEEPADLARLTRGLASLLDEQAGSLHAGDDVTVLAVAPTEANATTTRTARSDAVSKAA